MDPHAAIPSLIGVIHLAPLPGSPRFGGSLAEVADAAAADAAVLADTGFDGMIVENLGDLPLSPDPVEPPTVAAMTRCALAAKQQAPDLVMGINVLRNDAEAALAIALAAEARMVRINVHTGARLTDQGIIQGQAHATLRRRRTLGLEQVALLCDVAVKHSTALAPRPIDQEAIETVQRGLADAVLVTGAGTGLPTRSADLAAVRNAVQVPVLVASGVTAESVDQISAAHGVIVGSCLRRSGKAGDRIDVEAAARFAAAFHASRG
ncbi:MAG: BtpA/SgcQ family protein [Deltaproteobacteria bacterium]|nr:BtpA/SgcQ family protein [Deltaproteobacteria bacterium]